MKRNDITDIKEKIFFQNYENLFNVYLTADSIPYYNITRKVNIPQDMSSRYYSAYVVEYGDTWTGLSHKFYNDVKLWWIICCANNIQNPLSFPESGTVLNILNVDIVQSILSTIRDN
jgi:nucleoid-associated protein YgaU